MPKDSIKAKREAWQRARKVADTVEAAVLGKKDADSPKGHARSERLLLDRVRSKEYADLVGGAWLLIERHSKNGDEGQRVITRLLEAMTLAKNVADAEDYRLSIERLKELKGFADQLYVFFTKEVTHDPSWKILVGSRSGVERSLNRLIASLGHIQSFLAGRIEQFFEIFNQIGLTRETKADAAQRVVFSSTLSLAIHDIFGKWIDDVVAAFTEVAFEIEVTIDQIKHARRAATRRRVRTGAHKD